MMTTEPAEGRFGAGGTGRANEIVYDPGIAPKPNTRFTVVL
jgi:hypothetical protein